MSDETYNFYAATAKKAVFAVDIDSESISAAEGCQSPTCRSVQQWIG